MKSKQLLLNGEEIQVKRVLEHSKLEKLNKFIDWEIFRAVLEAKLRENKRPPRKLNPSLKVDYTAIQSHSQTEAFTAITVFVRRNFENLNFCVDVFNKDPVL